MDIQDVQRSWDEFGKSDPLWAVLTYPDKMGNRWEPEEFFATGVQDIDAVLHSLDDLGVRLNKERALDFGCAVGRLTQALAAHFDHVIGVDIAPSMLDLARKFNRHGDRCEYRLNNTDDLQQFPDACFTFILTLITLQHVEPRYSKRYLAEFLRALKPDGILVFQLPSHLTNEFRLRSLGKKVVPSSLLYNYRKARYGAQHADNPDKYGAMEMYGVPRAEVESLLEQAGGRVISVTQDSHAGNWISFRYVVQKESPRPK